MRILLIGEYSNVHWTLAEAINSSAVLYHLTGKQEYADDYAQFMQYLDEKRVELTYEMPLSEVLFDFYDRLKIAAGAGEMFDLIL